MKFTATAWAKLLFLRDYGETEVGGFGICPRHPLLVEDIKLIKQTCTFTTVLFDDDSVADFFEDQVAEGLTPEQFARVWIHTHPGANAEPSHTDEETFERVFGRANWAVMAILACGGDSYARLRLSGDHAQEMLLTTEVDFKEPFDGAAFDQWKTEYYDNITLQDSLWCDPWDWCGDDLLNPNAIQDPYVYPEDQLYDERFEPIHHADF